MVSMWRKPELVGQSLSAFCTSSLENISTIGRSHSLSETMLLLSLTLFGLVSSEHIGTSLNFKIGSVSDSNQMNAFYSDNIYYIPTLPRLSILFSIFTLFSQFYQKKKRFRFPKETFLTKTRHRKASHRLCKKENFERFLKKFEILQQQSCKSPFNMI